MYRQGRGAHNHFRSASLDKLTMSINYSSIAIEGNIGAGKTTLAHLLAKEINAKLILERYAENPFLSKFYASPQQYALPLELYFLEDRFRQQSELFLETASSPIVADYLWEKSYVFAKVNLQGDEWKLFERLYQHLAGRLTPPDLVLYLHRNTDRLQEQIATRGRTYEQLIHNDYLDDLSKSYQQFFKQEQRMPVLFIEENRDSLRPQQLLEAVLKLLEGTYEKGWQPVSL